jgi:hypothetical protein
MESLERCLAHGKVTDTLLAEAQANLLREAAEPVFFVGMRGERAHQHRIFLALEDGTLPKSAAFPPPKKFGDYFHFAHGYSMKEQHAWMLRWMNDVVEVSKLPPGEQLQRFPELMRQAKNAPPTARMLVSAFNKVGEAAIRSSVKLNCAATAIAVERFRLKFNRWPDSLDEVVAEKLLDEIPQDPYDGKPLRYRKTKDGVVIYSIGTKKDYGGDMLDEGRTPPPNTYRYEFLLWDEAHRRQPSRPQPKGDEEKKNGGV